MKYSKSRKFRCPKSHIFSILYLLDALFARCFVCSMLCLLDDVFAQCCVFSMLCLFNAVFAQCCIYAQCCVYSILCLFNAVCSIFSFIILDRFHKLYMDICAYIHIIMLKNKVKFFKALADGTRLTILSYLLEHGYCACDFSALTEKDQSTVSKHLKVLVEAEILKSEKRGRNIVYTIGDDRTRDLLVSLGINELKPCCNCPGNSGPSSIQETADK